MSAIQCPVCDEPVPAGHDYCGACGASLGRKDEAKPSVSSAESSSSSRNTRFFGSLQQPGRAKLIVIKGEGTEGISFALNASEHLAGRVVGVVLFPDDTLLSPQHANFFYRDDQLMLRDTGSQNGTFLRVREPVHITDGDLFLCGQQLLRMDTLEERAEYPTDDGTLHYVSPNRKELLRVVQTLQGGKYGTIVSSSVGEITVGRDGCDLCVPNDPHLSKRHARLTLERDGRVLLSDLRSKNGTFIRIKGEVRLRHGDYVFIGAELLRVEIIE